MVSPSITLARPIMGAARSLAARAVAIEATVLRRTAPTVRSRIMN
jgi:hypothetical protein